ncbi:MAG TPA: hypothetical protein VKJ07_25375, partial [Mycobacteriales bacterium]|nr:hypothetical protein [Mycobacteriales bacterium]
DEPVWSPNGTRRAFTRFVSNAHGTFDGSIRLARSDGTLVHALPGGRIGDGDPSWAPHGLRVAFVSGRAGRRQIFVAASDRPRVRQLTFGSAPSAEPSWSPQGSKIVFDRWVAKRLEIWVMNADGSGRQRVAVACDDSYSTDPIGLCAFATAHPVWQPGT